MTAAAIPLAADDSSVPVRRSRAERQAIIADRQANADPLYDVARASARPADVTPVLREIDATLRPGLEAVTSPGSGLANTGIEGALAGFRAKLANGGEQAISLDRLHVVKMELDDAIGSAVREGNRNRAPPELLEGFGKRRASILVGPHARPDA